MPEGKALKKLKSRGVPSPGRETPCVMEPFVYPAWEIVQKQGRGYKITIFENETTRLLF